ncbi:MAG TPA: MMPL family transporter [Solirubrobacteraceae bacterium]|nr:MMPL family transporter [Solirubrobacteraceae bacterium]
MRPSNLAARAGRWSAQHRRIAILGWIGFAVAATIGGNVIGTKSLAPAEMGNGSSRAADIAVDEAGVRDSSSEQVLLQTRSPDAAGARLRRAAAQLADRLERVPHVEQVVSPFDKGAGARVSGDGRSALLSFEIAGDDETALQRVDATLAATAAVQAQHAGLRIEQVGSASAQKAFAKALGEDFKKAETLSIPLTLLILLAAFGALVAAGLPLLLGLTAVGATLGLLGPISQLTPVSDQIGSVILLIGLAVGVDYSMFYVRREMEERDRGAGPRAALEAAAATSGHAIVVSGLIVLISMAGMLVSGSAVFVSFGVGTMTVVAVAVIGSLTFLPAMLSWLGEKGWTEKGRVPVLGRLRHRAGGRSRVWSAILDRVLARPRTCAAAAAALLVALAAPALGMHTLSPGIEGLPRDAPIRGTYERAQAAFPGTTEPAAVVVQATDVTQPRVRHAIAQLRTQAVATGRMAEPAAVRVNPDRTLAVVEIPLDGTGDSGKALASLAALREDVVPATVGRLAGVTVNVTGMTARSTDFNDTMKSRLPLVFGFVLGAAFLLLLVTFRSLVVPLLALVLNLLSVGASYGVLTLVFQHGWGESLLGFEAGAGITSWLPLFLFVVLFGLSMDYHVFILSRIREAVLGGSPTEDAVAHAIKSTAGVVTSAALVMIAVFSIFATLGAIEFKQMGVGLAAAILIDATIVRAVLLPATMALLGERNWYLPRRLSTVAQPRWSVRPAR